MMSPNFRPSRSFIATLLISLITIATLLLAGCRPAKPATAAGDANPGSLSGTLTISGAFALYPMMQRWAEEFQALHPDVQFDVSAGGAGKGMADALAGLVDIGMVSREITPEEIAQGAFWVPVAKDAVLPMVSAANPVLTSLMRTGVAREKFAQIFITGEITTWGQVIGDPSVTDEIHVYTRSDAAGAPETWAKYLGGAQEDLLGVGVFGDPGLLEAVIKDPLGIGYNNVGYAYDFETGAPVSGAVALPLDVNENGLADPEEVLVDKAYAIRMVAEGRYPSPPARALNLVTRGQPIGLTRAFLMWILTDGQQYLPEAGYVTLPQEQLDAAVAQLR
jgi:phosphate transport system substrate-binding protein